MKVTKAGETKETQFPTIVKIKNDYYIVSNPSGINGNLEIPGSSCIAINLKDGKWFDFDNELEPQMEVFVKGTKFEIEI